MGHAVADSDTGEDKLEVAAARERRTVADIAALYTDAFFTDLAALNVLPADVYPRASEYVEEMIAFAIRLEELGYTYRLPSGLYFDTSKSPGYGTLALLDLAGQRETGRVEHVEGRKHNSDFALWRAEEPGVRRVMRWNSPWGWGAPGWHLECSVMSMALLGEHFDIHTGGIDHRELHHVNEIAQSEAFLHDGRPWVRYWLHNEFLLLNHAKIAKSSGPVPRLADLVEAGYHPMAYRLFLLGGHYRSQLDFTPAGVDAAQATLRRLVSRVAPLRPLPVAETYEAARALVGRHATRPRSRTSRRSTRRSRTTSRRRSSWPRCRKRSATRTSPPRACAWSWPPPTRCSASGSPTWTRRRWTSAAPRPTSPRRRSPRSSG